MSNTNIEQLYDYYLQQVVAESYLEKTSDYSGEGLRTRLRFGTNRTPLGNPINQGYRGYTRLTDAQIDEFQAKFEVIHQWSDDPTPTGSRPIADGIVNPAVLANTGLSVTLVRKKDSSGNPTNEYTLAIRSTEFRDWKDGGGGERDKTATDLSEVAFNGFALAQLDALEKYYAWLKSSGKLPPNANLNVTGYSLGGHLATIFTEIHQTDTDIHYGETVTFNGAGRGTWDASKGSLNDMILFFRSTLVDLDYAKNDPLVPFDSFRWGAAKGAMQGSFDAKTIYNDPRYVWAAYATFKHFGVDNV